MKYVVDSSVAFKWVVREVDSDKADLLRADFLNGIHEFLSPDVYPVEVAHALTRAERQARGTVGQARHLLVDVLTTPPQFHSYRLLLSRAVDISSQRNMKQGHAEFATRVSRLISQPGPWRRCRFRRHAA